MMFSLEQFVLLAIVLVAGFLLGFASRPSTRKWKRKVAAQSESFTAYHADAEARVRAAREQAQALEDEAAALRSDREEAERTIAGLRTEREEAGRTIAELKAAPEPQRPAPALAHRPGTGSSRFGRGRDRECGAGCD